jgi:hypothetical protein
MEVHDEIFRRRINSTNVYFYSARKLLSSHISEDQTYDITISPDVLYGCETWSVRDDVLETK